MEEPKQTEEQAPPVASEEIQLLRAVEKNTRLTRIRLAWMLGIFIALNVIVGCNYLLSSV